MSLSLEQGLTDDDLLINGWSVSPTEPRRDNRLPCGARLLYIEIISLSYYKGYCWASNNYFATIFDVSTRTIIDWVNKLEELGYLKRELTYNSDGKTVKNRLLKPKHNIDATSLGDEEIFTQRGEENCFNRGEENCLENNINNINNININNNNITPKGVICRTEVQHCMRLWNELEQFGIRKIYKIDSNTVRGRCLKARLAEYSMEGYEKAIENIKCSAYLQGRVGKGDWIITFDWFVKPGNFAKVIEGNYNSYNSNRAEVKYADLEIY